MNDRISGLRVAAILACVACVAAGPAPAAADWQPADGPLMTPWADDVSPENAHSAYPRPQMVRKQWLNLNGLWDFAVTPRDAGKPESFGRKILVPFAAESAVSAIMYAEETSAISPLHREEPTGAPSRPCSTRNRLAAGRRTARRQGR